MLFTKMKTWNSQMTGMVWKVQCVSVKRLMSNVHNVWCEKCSVSVKLITSDVHTVLITGKKFHSHTHTLYGVKSSV